MIVTNFQAPIYQALTLPIMIGGVPRRLAILNITFGAAFILGMHLYYSAPLFILLHFIALLLAKHDPHFFDVILRHMKRKIYYDV